MKIFLIILVFMCSILCARADMLLQGGAEYNVQSALSEVKQNVQYRINPKQFASYFVDINRDENLSMLLKGQVDLKDRTLAFFSVGTYGIVYKNDPLHAYYYSGEGILKYVDVRTGRNYPYKSYQYDMSGNLVNMGLRISKGETYIYDANGKLMAHWVGANGYDDMGKLVMTRRFVE